jgi:urease accessory protein
MLTRADGWSANLQLSFTKSDWGSIATQREHSGPLRLQKVLYPESNDVAHAIVLHPPGGAVGGDSLNIELKVEAGAHVVATTPGAAKWYGCADSNPSSQSISLRVLGASCLEWLPQETIVFNQAHCHWTTTVHIDQNATFAGLEVVMLGRKARGEFFESGSITNRFELHRDSQLLFSEAYCLLGSDPRFSAPQGLVGQPCFGQLWVVADGALLASLIEPLQERLSAHCKGAIELQVGSTLVRDNLILVRALGIGPEAVRGALELAWHSIRKQITGRDPVGLRIWST